MKYVSPLYDRAIFETEDVIATSGGIQVNETTEGKVDYSMDIEEIF